MPSTRYTNEVNRLYGVMNKRLSANELSGGRCLYHCRYGLYRLVRGCGSGRGRISRSFPHLKRWLDAVEARPAVKAGLAVNAEDRKANDLKDPKVAAMLFNQKARD